MGNEQLLDLLPWSKTAEYTQQPRHVWESGVDPSLKKNYIPGRPDGYIKTHENLSFLKVIEAGHMVPMDQPAVSLAMLRTLVYQTGGTQKNGFLTSVQNLAQSSYDSSMCECDS